MRAPAAGVVALLVGTVVGDDEHVERRDAAVLVEADFRRPCSAGRAPPMECSSSRVMRIITGALAFFDSSAGIAIVIVPGRLAAEAAAGVLADEDDVLGLDADPARDRRRPSARCSACEQCMIQLAVLPVRHRRARSRASDGWCSGVDESLVEDERRVLEPGLEIAVRPLVRRLPIGSLPSSDSAKSSSVHFSSCDARRRARPAGRPRYRHAPQTLPSMRAFGPSGPQADERIDDERQRLELDLDLLDRFGGRELVDRRDRENRLAVVHRLVGQRSFACADSP